MTAEGNEANVVRMARSLLAEVARYVRDWYQRAPLVPEELEARIRSAPSATDAFFLDTVVGIERPYVYGDHRAAAAVLALSVRLTPTARAGLMTLATRVHATHASEAEYETLTRGVERVAHEFMPEVVDFIRQHRGELGGLPAMVVGSDRLDATLLEVLLTRLENNPRDVSVALGYFNEPRVLLALSDRLARLEREETIEWAVTVLNLAEAIVDLGGRLTKEQKADRRRAELIQSAMGDEQREAENALRERVEEGRTSTRRFRLDELARDRSGYVREAVGHNDSTGEATLMCLSRDASPDVRHAVAMNPSVGDATLMALAGDAAVEVREGVAGNPRTPENVQILLAGAVELEVRLALARCSDIYPAACALLLEDREAAVRGGVAATAPAAMIEEAVHDPSSFVRSVVAARQDLVLTQFEILAHDPDGDVRCNVAFNAMAPAAVLERLANDGQSLTAHHAKGRLAELAKHAAASASWTDDELPTPPEAPYDAAD